MPVPGVPAPAVATAIGKVEAPSEAVTVVEPVGPDGLVRLIDKTFPLTAAVTPVSPEAAL